LKFYGVNIRGHREGVGCLVGT